MTTSHAQAPTHTTRQGLPRWVPAIVLLISLLVPVVILLKPLKVMPRVAPAPSFNLIDQNGSPVSSADLRGRVVLVDFVYTHCTTVCPAMTGQMAQVSRRLAEDGLLGDDVLLVTITFDPERDTPERLRTYARQMNADGDAWLWLTGDPVSIRQLVGADYGVYFEQVPLDEDELVAAGHDPADHAGGYDFVHASVFVLIDGQGQIRSEYRQMLDIDQTLRDIHLVVRENDAPALLRPLWAASHALRAYP